MCLFVWKTVNLHRTLARRWNRGVPTLWKLCFKLFNLCLHWLLLGVWGIFIWLGGVYISELLLLLLFEITDGDNSIFIDSDGWDIGGTMGGGGRGCRRDGWYVVVVPLLVVISVLTDEYDWSLVRAIDCVDGCVVRIFSFCDTVDVLRWWRWICATWGNGGGGWDVGVSTDGLADVNAVILLKISFFITVGDEHGLTDGVLLADIVLLLNKELKILFTVKYACRLF